MSVTENDVKAPVDPDALLADLAAWWADPRPAKFTGTVPRRIAGGDWDQQIPEGTRNPYWEIIRQLPLEDMTMSWFSGPEPMTHVITEGPAAGNLRHFADRSALCGTFSWSIPSPGDMTWMRQVLDGRGVVEAGAGGGYWAWQMRQAGIDTVAYEPMDAADNNYVRREWTTLLRDGHDAPRRHPDRALFLCWPSYGDPWAAHALASYTGDMLIYAGESEGGCCADDEFFRLAETEFEETGSSSAHISYWGIHCRLTAYRRKTT